MRWTESTWFKHLSLTVVCIFFSQSVQPMAFGFFPSQKPASVSIKHRKIYSTPSGLTLSDQVLSLLNIVENKQEGIDKLPPLQELPERQFNETKSCTSPEADQHSSMDRFAHRNSSFIKRNRALTWAEFGKHWLERLFGLLVDEAHAQTQDPNLESTPDANTMDIFIVQKAQELGNDPGQIYAFVSEEIGYESYRGSLRGARGTLWSKAGNSLDQASLLIALLRASGVPARYDQGTLSDETSKQLILSMFSQQLSVVGCLPTDVEHADPANDPQLLAETREHYWVEFDRGNGFESADPTIVGAQIGDVFGSPLPINPNFSVVPGELRHKVTIRLKAEFNNSITGGLQNPKTVLEEPFNTVELVGHPLSIGHFVDTQSSGGAVFITTTHTYSPYILIGQKLSDLSDDELIRGQDYQELLSNLAFSTTFLTGVFLEMDVVEPEDETGQRAVETHDINRNKPRCSGCIKSSNDPKHSNNDPKHF